MNKIWIFGQQYDVTDSDDIAKLGAVISDAQSRQAPNDLALIASTLLGVVETLA